MHIRSICSLSVTEAAAQTLGISVYANKQPSHYLNRHLELAMRLIYQYFDLLEMQVRTKVLY